MATPEFPVRVTGYTNGIEIIKETKNITSKECFDPIIELLDFCIVYVDKYNAGAINNQILTICIVLKFEQAKKLFKQATAVFITNNKIDIIEAKINKISKALQGE
jgi:histidinol phosphatase-like PHP family hydrolase